MGVRFADAVRSPRSRGNYGAGPTIVTLKTSVPELQLQAQEPKAYASQSQRAERGGWGDGPGGQPNARVGREPGVLAQPALT